MRRGPVTVCLVAMVTASPGCGLSDDQGPEGVPAAAESSSGLAGERDVRCWGQHFANAIAANTESFADVLPNTLVKVKGSDEPPTPVTSLVVTGRWSL